MDINDGYALLKHALSGLIGAVLTYVSIASRYQTKQDCDKAHESYDKFIDQRFINVENKIDGVHEDVTEIKAMLNRRAR